MTLLVIHLFQTRVVRDIVGRPWLAATHSFHLQLSKESSSYQILKATLAFISHEDWTTKGVFMNPFDFDVAGFPESESRPSQEVRRGFHLLVLAGSYTIVILELSSGV